MAFGTYTTPKIWCMFFDLVMWIVIYVYLLPDLLHYMDNTWSYEMEPDLIYYELYDSWYPRKQVNLLLLYDKLGLPHIKKKQLFGHSLEIIGLLIDPMKMTISMSDMLCNELITTIHLFVC